jgi:hypothetical protein
MMHDSPDIALLTDGVDVPVPVILPAIQWDAVESIIVDIDSDRIWEVATGPPPLPTYIRFGVFRS